MQTKSSDHRVHRLSFSCLQWSKYKRTSVQLASPKAANKRGSFREELCEMAHGHWVLPQTPDRDPPIYSTTGHSPASEGTQLLVVAALSAFIPVVCIRKGTVWNWKTLVPRKAKMMLSVSDNFNAKTNVTGSSQRLMPLLRSNRVIEERRLNWNVTVLHYVKM